MVSHNTPKKTNSATGTTLPRIEAETSDVGSIEAQLISLYDEKKKLEDELGVSSPEAIIAMVRSMEQQLNEFYGAKLDK